MRVIVFLLCWVREEGEYSGVICCCCSCRRRWLALLEIRVVDEEGMLAVEISDRGGRIRFEDKVCFCRVVVVEEEEEEEGEEGWRGNGDTPW